MELVSGTWREEGNTLTLSTSNPPTLITGTYASGAITYSDNGRTYVWRRD